MHNYYNNLILLLTHGILDFFLQSLFQVKLNNSSLFTAKQAAGEVAAAATKSQFEDFGKKD